MIDNKYEIERCDCKLIHEDIVNKVRQIIPGDEQLDDLAELLKVFGDTTRIKILWALAEAEMCLCDIVVLLNMTQSATSHLLRLLKQARFESFEQFYSKDMLILAGFYIRVLQ